MTRHPENRNLTLYENATYMGLPVQQEHGPLIENHLKATYDCMQKSLRQYKRVSVMRFDLHLPEGVAAMCLSDNMVMERFFASLRAKIKNSQIKNARQGHRVHETKVRFTWAREISRNGRVHYHVTLLVNHDAYAHIGEFSLANNNTYSRIHQAWASALNMFPEDVQGLIHIPRNAVYYVRADDELSQEEAFFRLSYCTKAASKEFGQAHHSFGASRI